MMDAVDEKITSSETSPVNDKVWLYEENIKKLYTLDDNPDRKSFLDEFFNYRKKNGLYSKIPVIAKKPLDVFVLYYIVQKYGGIEETMKNRMWSQIARELDLPRTMTSGAFTLKLKYIRLLYQFECHKCKKRVNNSILYNGSTLSESSECRVYDNGSTLSASSECRVYDNRFSSHTRMSELSDCYRDKVSKPIDRKYIEIEDKSFGRSCKTTEDEYRKSLYRRRRNSPIEETKYHSICIRNPETRHPESYPVERISPVGSDDTFNANISATPRLEERYELKRDSSKFPYLDEDGVRGRSYLKRKYSEEKHTNYEEEHRREKIQFHQISIELMELRDNKFVIKLKMNNEKYEGVLQPY